MSFERLWESIGPVLFTANGGADGTVTLPSTAGFKVKQTVVITAVSELDLTLEVKKVLSPTKLLVGPKVTTGKMLARQDLSLYTTAKLSAIKAIEQSKNKLQPADIIQAVYEQEPTVALRTFGVDEFGTPWRANNPFPVRLSDGSINIGSVNAELEVQLSHKDNYPNAGDVADSVRVGNGVNELDIEDDGSINTNSKVIFQKSQTTPFNHLRTSTITNVLESLFNFDKQPLLWDETLATGGTSTWNSVTNSVDCVTTTSNGSSVVRQTFRRVPYNPARSVIVQISTNMGGNQANCRRRIGQFDINNGLFFELDGSVKKVVVRNNAVDTAVIQSAWNLDKLDGTGTSGLTIDLAKHQLFVIEYAWQGIAEIRFGFYLNGSIVYCHTVNTANVNTVPYMKTANLPLRTEITNTGATASNTTMSSNCFIVKNEGESNEKEGILRTFVITTARTISTAFYPVISIRLDTTYIASVVDILKAFIYVDTVDDVVWELRLNGTLTGDTFANSVGYVDIDNAATVLTGGTSLDSGFLFQRQNNELASADMLKLMTTTLGTSIANASDVLTLAVSNQTGNADIRAGFTWREF